MTAVPQSFSLIADLPVQVRPRASFWDWEALVPELLELHPEWSGDDLQEIVEDKLGRALHPEDQITLRAVWQRTHLFPAEAQNGAAAGD